MTKYSYQDWVNGNLTDNDTFKILTGRRISQEDFAKIAIEQTAACTKYLLTALKTFKEDFNYQYSRTFTKDAYLDLNIKRVQERIDKLLKYRPGINNDSLYDFSDGRYKLTKAEVDKYNSVEVNDKEMSALIFFYHGFNIKMEGKETLIYILHVNFYKWLLWFKEHVESKNLEPTFYSINSYDNSSINLAIEISKRQHITWRNLFKEPEQADKITQIISEHLSSTGQWITGKAGRHLMALYSELKQKGYLKPTLSAPTIANALNTQFDTDLTFKNFQPGELAKAEDYRINFNHIPVYKPKFIT